MDNDLLEAYGLAQIDRDELSYKQREYLDKIFSLAIKFSIISEEPLESFTLDLRQIAQDILKDPIFTDYDRGESESDFSEFDPTNVS